MPASRLPHRPVPPRADARRAPRLLLALGAAALCLTLLTPVAPAPAAFAQDPPAVTDPELVGLSSAALEERIVELDVRVGEVSERLVTVTGELGRVTAAHEDAAGELAATDESAASAAEDVARTRRQTADAAVRVFVSGGQMSDLASVLSSEDAATAGQSLTYGRAVTERLDRLASEYSDARDRLQSRSSKLTERIEELTARIDRLSSEVTALESELTSLQADRMRLVEARQVAEAREAREAAERAASLEAVPPGVGFGDGTGGEVPPPVAPVADIPPRVLAAYHAAARRLAATDPACGVPWWLIAGIGKVETNHGRYRGASTDVNGKVTPHILGPDLDGTRFKFVPDTDGGRMDGSALFERAVGPMQFLPATFMRWGADGDGDGFVDPHDIDDASVATGRYLCSSRRGMSLMTVEGQRAAVFTYNRSTAYVNDVLGFGYGYRDSAR